jgi:hypothetical protein
VLGGCHLGESARTVVQPPLGDVETPGERLGDRGAHLLETDVDLVAEGAGRRRVEGQPMAAYTGTSTRLISGGIVDHDDPAGVGGPPQQPLPDAGDLAAAPEVDRVGPRAVLAGHLADPGIQRRAR